jgi:putative oxygen-independent coproporphyrinogen III oxidase
LPENWQEAGFGLYVHWPFCLAKCPYCDFNSHVAASIDQRRWAAAYVQEIGRVAAETPGRVLRSVFFGGGTPSLMRPETVAAVLDAARRAWTFANDIEITLEANPTSVEAGRFRGYAEAGVNRLSMGVQALNDADLRALGRMHSAAEARVAFDIARAIFPRISFDLIYARQNQSLRDWAAELRGAIAMAVDHLSLYQLTIEPGTAFGAHHAAGKLRGLPDEDLAADMWEVTQEITAESGLAGYESSNHAAPGSESRHNLIYWRQGDYAGIGPGAHGRLTLDGRRLATESPLAPGAWLAAVDQGSGESLREMIGSADLMVERLMMGLRLTEGLPRERCPTDDRFLSRINGLAEDGLMWTTPTRIGVTAAGRPVLNAVLRALLTD